jgi:hypothetical protein
MREEGASIVVEEERNLEAGNTGSVPVEEAKPRTLKSLVNTPFKKVMFGVQLLSYVLIVGSPVIGGAIGGLMGLKAARTGGLILGIFIAGEVLFYGSLIFLGKEIVLLVRDKARGWFRKKR